MVIIYIKCKLSLSLKTNEQIVTEKPIILYNEKFKMFKLKVSEYIKMKDQI